MVKLWNGCNKKTMEDKRVVVVSCGCSCRYLAEVVPWADCIGSRCRGVMKRPEPSCYHIGGCRVEYSRVV